jgi:hypothetical protein
MVIIYLIYSSFLLFRPEIDGLGLHHHCIEVDDIFAEIEPFFAKRWLKVQLALETPQQGPATCSRKPGIEATCGNCR